MAIFAQAVVPVNQPIAYTSVAGTSAQPITSAVLTVGSAVYNGKPFEIVAQGYVKAHGATQTLAFGLQGQAYSTGAFSGTQLATGTASGTLTAGTYYPFFLRAQMFADNTSGILSGFYTVADGVTPTLKAGTIVAAKLTGITFGSNAITGTTYATNPLGAAQTPALQFALTITNSVSDTAEIFYITSFYATNDN